MQATASTLQFTNVVYPKTFKINTASGWYLSGGMLSSNVMLSTIKSEILNSSGGVVSTSGIKSISGYNYSIATLDTLSASDNGVKFSKITTAGNYVWRLTATDSSGRSLTLNMPFTAVSSGSTSTATMSSSYVMPTGVTLSQSSLALAPGSEATLTATVSPSDASNKGVTWSSSDPAVATVAGGVVTAVASGSATVTCTTVDGGKTATCAVTVTRPVTGVSLDRESATLDVNDTLTLTATVSPDDATEKGLTWSSSDPAVATVADGVVTAVATGSATITCTTVDGGKTAACAVTVEVRRPVTGISLDKKRATIDVGSTLALTATILPDDASNKSVTWSSSDPTVATVADGVVTAVAAGSATVTCTTADGGKTATCAVTVTQPVTEVSLDMESATLDINDTLTLTAAISPVNATNKNVTWSSSDPSVATVSGGVVTAVGVGTARITCMAEDGSGVSGSCMVTVEILALSHDRMQLLVSDGIGGKAQLTLMVNGVPVSAERWSTSNSGVATVNRGVVTAVSGGSCVVAARYRGKDFSCSVEVTADPKQFVLPAAMRVLADEALSGTDAEAVLLGDQVREIGRRAFAGCGALRVLYIPANVTAIGEGAFAGCGRLVIFGRTGSTAERYAQSLNIPFFSTDIEEIKTYEVTLDANGGACSAASLTGTCGEPIGALPTPTRDYFTFVGWYTAADGGRQVTASTVYNEITSLTLYAHWTENAHSDWVPLAQLPAEARVVDRQWTYTETTQSVATSLSGWTATGDYTWRQTGTGSRGYASIPSGFDTGHALYAQYNNSAYSASETDTTKREVRNTSSGYIYWHWMYNCDGSAGTSIRAIYNKYGYGPDNGYLYQYFGAFTSTNGSYANDIYYCNSLNIRNYIVPERTAYSMCQGSTRWFRFDIYTSTYTDYEKLRTRTVTASTEPVESDAVSNIQAFVKYQLK